MYRAIRRIQNELRRSREQKALAHDFHAAPPQVQEDFIAAFRRSS